MRSWLSGWFHRHRALIGYLFILAVVTGVLQWHHVRTTNDLRVSDRKTCQALEEVTDNQRFVLSTLTIVIAHQTSYIPAPDLVSRLNSIERRLVGLPKYNCSRGLVSVR